jgi:hypothetical protein
MLQVNSRVALVANQDIGFEIARAPRLQPCRRTREACDAGIAPAPLVLTARRRFDTSIRKHGHSFEMVG